MSVSGPTFSGYLNFIRTVMAISTAVLPDNSIYIPWSYQMALRWVNTNLQQVQSQSFAPPDGLDPTYPSLYAVAVYNLAGDRLVNYAQDVLNAPPVQGGTLPYFANLRATYKLNAFVAGAVNSTSDEGTSVSLTVPESLGQLTFDNLQRMKTPWGREYLGIAQSLGPSAWGLT
jgi:hypothetical protein